MSVLLKRLPPGETIVWISKPTAATARQRAQIVLWAGLCAAAGIALALVAIREPFALAAILGLLGVCALLFVGELSDTEIAVLPDHVVWKEASSLGWLVKRDLPRVRLDSIDHIDAEEGGNSVTLHCGGQSHRIEEIVGGDIEAFARATGRPARIWRRCSSRSAGAARRWRSRTRFGAWLSVALGLLLLMLLAGDQMEAYLDDVPKWVFVVGAGIASLIVSAFADVCGGTLPHLLVGRSLTGQDRRDFVCTASDPRWDGVQPDDPQHPPARGPFQRWAMRLAYGEVPDNERWEPEIITLSTGGRQS